MASAFDNSSVVKNHDNVGVLNGGKAVGNYENCAAFHKHIHSDSAVIKLNKFLMMVHANTIIKSMEYSALQL